VVNRAPTAAKLQQPRPAGARRHPGFGTPRRLSRRGRRIQGPSLPPRAHRQDVTLGSWSVAWPQIRAISRLLDGERGPSAGRQPAPGEITAAAPTALTPRRPRGLAGCISGAHLRPARPSPVGKVERRTVGLGRAHPLGFIFYFSSFWSTLTSEICHDEGTGATSASNEAH